VITLSDVEGRERVLIGVEPDGTAAITLSDEAGRLRASLGVRPDGSPAMVLRGGDGEETFRAPRP